MAKFWQLKKRSLEQGLFSLLLGLILGLSFGPTQSSAQDLVSSPPSLGLYGRSIRVLERFSGASSFLSYVHVGPDEVRADGRGKSDTTVGWLADFDQQVAYAKERGINLVPQLAFENIGSDLTYFEQELRNPASLIGANTRLIAKKVADFKGLVYIRPFSEMNDSLGAWALRNSSRKNTSQSYARAWIALRQVFREAGATHVRFAFAPLVARGMESTLPLVSKTLALIPRTDVDLLGLNVYSRGVSFEQLAEPWMQRLRSGSFASLALMVPEMGVSIADDGPTQIQKVTWIREAYPFVRKHRFEQVTYFEGGIAKGWLVGEGTPAERELQSQIALGL
jgi:hypothetical protein